ncbi:MAG: four helix bundle protein [Salibacteraceae bacterium]|jgi:four helix bundle protein|nr:four helix bundle protein [Salibacteraceae bacterium]MDP4685267.1 four helix bundle protein [Salibacteraceae bacterium]MDP4762543.1 four helix bundle protein [Salibacteraceae bacterium]
MKNFKQLKIWQTGKEIAIATFKLSQKLDRSESFTFSSQITRAALSIPSNIAEGSSRKSKKDYARFIEIALGSSFELETQLEIMSELEIVPTSEVKLIELINEEQRMLYGFLKALKTDE